MNRQGCTGSCCAVFPLSVDHARLLDRWPYYDDAEQILDMVIPLDLVSALERCIELGIETFHARPGAEYFACRHWNTETRLCEIYETRPKMCRNYPYATACAHCARSDGKPLRGSSPCPPDEPATC